MYNPYLITGIIFIIGLFLIYLVLRKGKAEIPQINFSEEEIGAILDLEVLFYKKLATADKDIFRKRVLYFLRRTKISAEKGAVVTVTDKVLVAASATIPLFHFKNWAYENLDEVLIYPDFFTEKFDTQEGHRNVAGMVGSGALNHKMILSQPALRAGFKKNADGNTAIHEFVHLIDKADGAIDGIPEYLIPKELIQPWLHEMNKTIREIRTTDSDIRDYAATNPAEFLAVISEYFFEKPQLLKEDHPKLYALLDEIYTNTDAKAQG